MREDRKISEQEADRLIAEGAGTMFDVRDPDAQIPPSYFEPKNGNPHIVVIADDTYYVRSIEDLESGPDGVIVRFLDESDGRPLPSADEVFKFRQL
ncbi:MAG: hypothetical protein A3A80_02050 [Candidatus Terrybacteria bacterium RIFCSPLOWO2_01_FULL_44_24]|uniref:Uncharacterized protein n=1 Tax=Candidatus Terrybacteria bacterium RIFCSPHIGHO2_01_FULL_43_35 TaxID=1802361 RepID=A0A1G2PE63_9BACT|nr:MAG: hypothetical protein A2828_01840 [Candidatus Terrybacteria bacterium RIFCSPHIGHO2_01_FULL_43_35]OHA50863.1 MAG: hypothetical protein A3A80_02050 [Candidatus Terrybacteria bacterium RIFCSPLOWO2_01_FULL_44_24]